MSKTEIQKRNKHDKYVGGDEDVTIEWDGKTELINNDENKGYVYLHQTPPYRVRFKFTKDEITAIFDTACDKLYHHDNQLSLQTNKETGHQDSYWFFEYPVGFEIYTSTDINNKIECTNTWSWSNSNNAEPLYISKKWKDIIGTNTNIESYLYADNKVYFRPICQGCCRPNRDQPVPFIDDHDDNSKKSNIGKNCVRCAKYRYVLKKTHQHIAPNITVLKTTGTTIKIKASDGNAFEGKLNTDSRYNDSTNNELLFTNLKKETIYTLTIRQKCSCGEYFYCTKKIKTWDVIFDDKKSLDVLNCGGYHRIHVAANQKKGTIGINSNSGSGNDGIKYDLYNSINNGANIDTFKTSIDHNSGNNYYTERGGRYSSIAKFTGLDSDTYYYCEAYNINNITNQNNTPDTIKKSIFKTAKKFTVDNVSIIPKNDKVIISATISNLDDTYIKNNNNNEYINGLNKLEIGVTQINTETTKTKTLTNLTISNIKNTYSFKISTSVDELSPGTSYNITLDFTGYSKYGIVDRTTNTDENHVYDTNEECKRSIQRSFTTASANGEIINLESSIKAVKFDFKIDDDSLGTGSKYKASLYTIIGDTKTSYKDKYIKPDNSNINSRPKYELLSIPNNKFEDFQGSNTTKIIRGLSFGVFNNNNQDNFTYLYGENNDYDESVGIDCNTTYKIEIIDTTNNNIVAEYYFSTKQLEAETDIIARQDSITLITKPIITINNEILTDSDENNNIITSYIDKDTINTKSKIRTVIEYNNNNLIENNSYGIEAYSHEDYRSDNDLNSYVSSVNNDNAIFDKEISNNIIKYKYICHNGDINQSTNQDHEVKIINNQNNQYDHTEIIHKFNNLTYYCYHRVFFKLTDGYNNTDIEIYCNTAFPYAFISLHQNIAYVASQIETYVYHDGVWKIIIPHICKKYLDSNNEEHIKWLVCDGNQEEIVNI